MSMDSGCACMRRIILVLLALVFLVTGCVQIGNQPAAKDKRRAAPVVDGDAAIRHIERDMLANIRENGFNSDPVINGGMGGLLVNWRYDSHPLQANINGTGETDAD